MNDLLFLIKASRPAFWLGASAFFIIGAISSNLSGFPFWIGLFFSTLPAGIIINGMNDIADRKSDAQNPRKIAENKVLDDYKAKLIQMHAIGYIFAFVMFFSLLQQYDAVVVLTALLCVWWAYSFKPFRFKGIPLVDSLTNGIGMLLFLILAHSLSNTGYELIWNQSFFWILGGGVVAVHALQTLWDIESDQQIGDRTIGGLLQKRGTILFSLCIFLSIFLFWRAQTTTVTLYLLMLNILCMFMLIKPTQQVIYKGTWAILYSFPLLVTYLLIFERQSLLNIIGF